ncbi:WbqC family protein [bacterium]|nr:WbqC family protein [bacterium]
MKIAIMQPYFFPYIGYFQLINAVDEFIIYDEIEYTKKGWINRNRILVNGKDEYITLPLKKSSDFLNVNERYLADT